MKFRLKLFHFGDGCDDSYILQVKGIFFWKYCYTDGSSKYFCFPRVGIRSLDNTCKDNQPDDVIQDLIDIWEFNRFKQEAKKVKYSSIFERSNQN